MKNDLNNTIENTNDNPNLPHTTRRTHSGQKP